MSINLVFETLQKEETCLQAISSHPCLGQIIQWKTTDVRMHRPKIGADVNMRIWF